MYSKCLKVLYNLVAAWKMSAKNNFGMRGTLIVFFDDGKEGKAWHTTALNEEAKRELQRRIPFNVTSQD